MNRRSFFGRAVGAIAALFVAGKADAANAFEPNDWVTTGRLDEAVPCQVHSFRDEAVYDEQTGKMLYIRRRISFSVETSADADKFDAAPCKNWLYGSRVVSIKRKGPTRFEIESHC